MHVEIEIISMTLLLRAGDKVYTKFQNVLHSCVKCSEFVPILKVMSPEPRLKRNNKKNIKAFCNKHKHIVQIDIS